MNLRLFLVALVCEYLAGVLFYPARLPRRTRMVTAIVLLAGILAAPLLIPSHARFLRLLAAVNAVMVGVRVYDEYWEANRGRTIGFWTYLAALANPFALVLRRVSAEPARSRRIDIVRAVIGLVAGAAAILLLIRIF